MTGLQLQAEGLVAKSCAYLSSPQLFGDHVEGDKGMLIAVKARTQYYEQATFKGHWPIGPLDLNIAGHSAVGWP